MRRSYLKHAALAVLLLAGCGAAAAAAALQEATVAAKSPMTVEKQYPQLSQQVRYTKLYSPEMAEYIDDPVGHGDAGGCTILAAENSAISNALKLLGKYAGLFAQNETMQEKLLNYHVIPGRRIRAQELGTNVTSVLTRANETLWFTSRDGKPYVSFRRDYIIPIKTANIRTGDCLMHTMSDMLLIPPTLTPTWDGWLAGAGSKAPTAPKAQWVKAMPSLPGADEGDMGNAVPGEKGTVAEKAPGDAPATAAAAPAPAKSAAGSTHQLLIGAQVAVMAVVSTMLALHAA